MLDDKPKEFGPGDFSNLPFLCGTVLKPVGYLAVLTSEDILFQYHTSIEVATQVSQCFGTGTYGFTIDDPFFRITLG